MALLWCYTGVVEELLTLVFDCVIVVYRRWLTLQEMLLFSVG